MLKNHWTVLWGPTWSSTSNTQKRCPFQRRGLECKSKKSRDPWSNRQAWPWNMEWSRAKTHRVLQREHTDDSKYPLPKKQEMTLTLHMGITRWSILKSHWLYSLQSKTEKLYTVSKNKTGSQFWLDHELLIAKFRLKLKVGKTTRSLSYDLSQISYDYTVEMTNSTD